MKKGMLSLCMISMGVSLLLYSCDKKAANVQSDMDAEQNDFVTYTGANMVYTPEGYYALQNGFLYYISPDFSKSTVVCDKPECIHHDLDIENLNEYTVCNAFFLGNPIIDYYDGYLYIGAGNDVGYGDAIYKLSLDGSERKKYYVSEAHMQGFDIYRGNVYLGEEYYTAEKKTQKITRFPVEDPGKMETLFETDQYPEGTLNRMRFYDGNCYFYIVYSEETEDGYKNGGAYYTIDLGSGEVNQISDQPDCNWAWNDYGILVEMKKFVGDTPKWTSEYYRIDPHTGDKTELTGEDFVSIDANDMFENMDDRYLYFMTKNWGEEVVPKEQQRIFVYDYEGNLAAEIPSGDFEGSFYVLPGTEQYMFIQMQKDGLTNEFYYVDKEKFDGGRIEATKIEFSGRG